MMWHTRCEQVGNPHAMTPTMSDSVPLITREVISRHLSAKACSKGEEARRSKCFPRVELHNHSLARTVWDVPKRKHRTCTDMFKTSCAHVCSLAFAAAFQLRIVWVVSVWHGAEPARKARSSQNCTNTTIQNNCKNEINGTALPMPLAVTRTRGRSRSSSCSVRLLSPCCLQHGGFGPNRKRAKATT